MRPLIERAPSTRSLQVINLANGLDLAPCPNKLRRDFFDAYKNDPEMKTVGARLASEGGRGTQEPLATITKAQAERSSLYRQVDAFLCNHACSLCEVFMSFNKSLIVIASTRWAGLV